MRAMGADDSEHVRSNNRESGSVHIRWLRKIWKCVTIWGLKALERI